MRQGTFVTCRNKDGAFLSFQDHVHKLRCQLSGKGVIGRHAAEPSAVFKVIVNKDHGHSLCRELA